MFVSPINSVPNRFQLRRLLTLMMLASLVALASCASGSKRKMTGETLYIEGVRPSVNGAVLHQGLDTKSWWKGDGVSGTPSIKISLNEQKAYFYKSNQLVGVASISTGDENHRTPTGVFSISQKSPDHKSSQYGDYVDAAGNVVRENVDRNRDPLPSGAHFDGASMPYFLRFNSSIGMHAGYLPGYPASHGCVRMPREMAEAFFRNASEGTKVEVHY